MAELEYSWKRLQDVKLMDRSVSQVQEYLDELGGCKYKYFLNRVVRLWDRPAAWFPQGTAVHAAAEYWELSGRTASRAEVKDRYRDAYREDIFKYAEKTPNLNYWSPSYTYIGWKDITRRAFVGEKQLDNYLDYYEKYPDQQPWVTPQGDKAVELKFRILLDKVRAQGYIDQVMGSGVFVVRDLKTGKKPGGMLQLKLYAIALKKEFDLDVVLGDYFLLDKRKPTKSYDLTEMSEEQVVDLFGKTNEGIRMEDFEPSPDPEKCRMCPFNQACSYSEA